MMMSHPPPNANLRPSVLGLIMLLCDEAVLTVVKNIHPYLHNQSPYPPKKTFCTIAKQIQSEELITCMYGYPFVG